MKGDRLEPTPTMPDIGAGLDDAAVPITLCFWRCSAETVSRHRNPLFAAELGVVPERILMVDWMHTLSLGVYQNFLGHLFQAMFAANVWQLEGNMENRIKMSCIRLRAQLFQWYAEEAQEGRVHTRVQNLLPQMFGSPQDPHLGLHAAETNGMLAFAYYHLGTFATSLPNHAKWARAAQALLRGLQLIRSHKEVFPPEAIQEPWA